MYIPRWCLPILDGMFTPRIDDHTLKTKTNGNLLRLRSYLLSFIRC